jgi:hypothetical protein
MTGKLSVTTGTVAGPFHCPGCGVVHVPQDESLPAYLLRPDWGEGTCLLCGTCGRDEESIRKALDFCLRKTRASLAILEGVQGAEIEYVTEPK